MKRMGFTRPVPRPARVVLLARGSGGEESSWHLQKRSLEITSARGQPRWLQPPEAVTVTMLVQVDNQSVTGCSGERLGTVVLSHPTSLPVGSTFKVRPGFRPPHHVHPKDPEPAWPPSLPWILAPNLPNWSFRFPLRRLRDQTGHIPLLLKDLPCKCFPMTPSVSPIPLQPDWPRVWLLLDRTR